MNKANRLHFSHDRVLPGFNEYNQHGGCNRLGLRLNEPIIDVAKYHAPGVFDDFLKFFRPVRFPWKIFLSTYSISQRNYRRLVVMSKCYANDPA